MEGSARLTRQCCERLAGGVRRQLEEVKGQRSQGDKGQGEAAIAARLQAQFANVKSEIKAFDNWFTVGIWLVGDKSKVEYHEELAHCVEPDGGGEGIGRW